MTEPHDLHEIQPETGALDEGRQVLKKDDTFVVMDRWGDIRPLLASQQGLFHAGTRFLSRLTLRLDESRPLLLGSSLRDGEALFDADFTNPDLRRGEQVALPRGTLHLRRRIRIESHGLRMEVALRTFALARAELQLEVWFGADFIDLFELRGERRRSRGRQLPPQVAGSEVVLAYVGLDEIERRTRLRVSEEPSALDDRHAVFALSLEPGQSRTLALAVLAEPDPRAAAPWVVPANPLRVDASAPACEIESSNAAFDAWLRRSRSDLAMMVTQTPYGPYPYAGVPWFSTPFGRDALVTALETLWCDPSLARGVLCFLAAHQAEGDEPEADAESGKILHEMRAGEMASLGEIPFRRYYGSVDVTPLFVLLAAAYHERTADDDLLEELWPNLLRALAWIEGPGDRDGDGFLEYERRAAHGLSNHGWKDSWDAISHADGELARGPIALCEVQGYAYAARRGLARLAARLGHAREAARLDSDADLLRERFTRAFWCEDLATYALALDGDKRPCRVTSSNAGHALFSGVAQPRHAALVAAGLLGPGLFSGWGVRTLSADAARYNPMSYHNGSVWPHDNALVALGLARYGHRAGAGSVLESLFQATGHFDDARLPELFCGFERSAGEGPTQYPTACRPQAWAAGAVFLLLQAVLGLAIDADRREVRLHRPSLPVFLEQLTLRGLRVRDARVDLRFERSAGTTGVVVLERSANVRVTTSS